MEMELRRAGELYMVTIMLLLLKVQISSSQGVEHPKCFRFTWLGAFQDKKNIFGLTCEHIREDLTYIPCRRPLVATDNDQPPDTIDLWRNFDNENPNLFTCPMIPGQACVKYTYIYNDAVQNITYMCAKVNASNGCYIQKYITGLEVEVCVCTSSHGMMPCNDANANAKHQQLSTIDATSIWWWLTICVHTIYTAYRQQQQISL